MKKFAMIAATAVLAGGATSGAYAAYFSVDIPSLSGDFAVTGFADGTPNTYSISLTSLQGGLTVTNYGKNTHFDVTVGPMDSGSGPATASAVLFPGTPGETPLAISTNTVHDIFSGTIDATGIPYGVTTIGFGGPAFSVPVNVSSTYNGQTTPAILALLNGFLGTSFVDPTGSGTIQATGMITESSVMLNIVETATDWPGFGALLDGFAAPMMLSGVVGTFNVSNLNITAIPEPASLALLGLGLAGLGAMRRRKTA